MKIATLTFAIEIEDDYDDDYCREMLLDVMHMQSDDDLWESIDVETVEEE